MRRDYDIYNRSILEPSNHHEQPPVIQKDVYKSKVLMLKNLVRGVTDNDVAELIKVNTNCRSENLKIYLQIMNGMGFVEFDDEEDCYDSYLKLVRCPIVLDGKTVKAVLSKRSHVSTVNEQMDDTKVVLITVTNLVSNVTVPQLYKVFSQAGVVQKVFIFAENTTFVRGFIEFEKNDDAKKAIEMYNNENLLNGAHTMHLEPSKVPSIEIYNHRNAWDYTIDPKGYTASTTKKLNRESRSVLRAISAAQSGQKPINGLEDLFRKKNIRRVLDPKDVVNTQSGYNRVVVLYRVPSVISTPEAVFNLFSTCGQIERIKLMRDNESTALIQYTDSTYAVIALSHFNNVVLEAGTTPLKLAFSKNSEIVASNQGENANLTRTFRARAQRFPVKEDRYLRQACPPTRTLFITPLCLKLTDQEIIQRLEEINTVPLNDVKLTRMPKNDTDFGSIILKMRNKFDAIHVLAKCHNTEQDGKTIRVSFSRQK